jgi:hypothetical protein
MMDSLEMVAEPVLQFINTFRHGRYALPRDAAMTK